MYNYLTLSISLILVSVLLFLRLHLKLVDLKVLLILSLIMLLTMLIFDSYLTRLPIVMYNNVSILNVKLGSIPIEDFGYLFAVVILVPALFEKFDNEK